MKKTATKPLRTGYNGTDPYNFYYDNNQSPKLQAALADESAINKKGDLAKGVRYISQNSTGYKCSGKQTNLNSIDQYSSTAVAGVEGDTNIDYYSDSFLPWWHDNGDWSLNGEKGANSVKSPTYGIIEVSKDKIHVTLYQVTGHMSSEEVNGVQMPTSPDFEVVRNGMSRTVIYECEILATDRDRTGRA